MFVVKCNLCGKQIKGEPIEVGRSYSDRMDLCEKCGAPILAFIKKYEDKNLKNNKRKKR